MSVRPADLARWLARHPVVAITTIVALVAVIYWPVLWAGFIWIDKVCFHDVAWLRVGSDSWRDLLFHNFYDWTNYFRPLVVALFLAEERLFGVAPAPMHAVSLALHLCNTLLVGQLAMRLFATAGEPPRRTWKAGLAMLVYGLHPALIEPVVWISCQFELVVTGFVLLGLLCNVAVRHSTLRAAAVAGCFFLAACAKESAVVFPILLVICDWMGGAAEPRPTLVDSLRRLWQRQWRVYLAVLAAGIAYLALRHWALGSLLQSQAGASPLSLQRLQMVCWLLVTYWRILVWPMLGQGPLHEVGTRQFQSLGAPQLASDLLAIVIVAAGLVLLYRRRAFGALLIGASVALLPVLHIVPVDFDSSLYHERYAMTAIAVACAILPQALHGLAAAIGGRARFAAIFGYSLMLAWLALATLNIRVTLPLWSDETRLWQWAVRNNPDSALAANHLLSAYMEKQDYASARPIARFLLNDRRACPVCLVNVANMAMGEGDIATARRSLHRAERMLARVGQRRLDQLFALSRGHLRELELDAVGATADYRHAIELEPLDPAARMSLAILLARTGNIAEAQAQGQLALELYAPDERTVQEQRLRQALTSAAGTPPKP